MLFHIECLSHYQIISSANFVYIIWLWLFLPIPIYDFLHSQTDNIITCSLMAVSYWPLLPILLLGFSSRSSIKRRVEQTLFQIRDFGSKHHSSLRWSNCKCNLELREVCKLVARCTCTFCSILETSVHCVNKVQLWSSQLKLFNLLTNELGKWNWFSDDSAKLYLVTYTYYVWSVPQLLSLTIGLCLLKLVSANLDSSMRWSLLTLYPNLPHVF